MRVGTGGLSEFASDAAESTVGERIDAMVSEIKARSEKSNEDLLKAANAIRDLRRLVDSGVLGPNVRWTAWAPKRTGLGIRRLQDLQAVAESEDPRLALEELLKKRAAAVKKHREAEQMREPGAASERRKLCKWARTADAADVVYCLRCIEDQHHQRELLG